MGRIILVFIGLLFYLWGVTGYNLTYLWRGRFIQYFVYVEWEDKEGKNGNLQSIVRLSKEATPKGIADTFMKDYGYTRVVIKSIQRM